MPPSASPPPAANVQTPAVPMAAPAPSASVPLGPTADITPAKLDLLEKLLRQGVAGELNSRVMTAALSQAQLVIGAMRKRILELKKTNDDLLLLQSGAARDAVSQAALDVLSRDLKHFGTAFQLLWEPFSSEDDFATMHEEGFVAPTLHPEHPDRYAVDGNEELGFTAELLHFIPARYHSQMLSSKVFAQMFCKQVQGARSLALDRLRRALDVLFPALPSEVFGAKPAARKAREACPDLWHTYLGLAAPTDQLESLLPPVLYRDLDKSNDDGLFLNDMLFTMARIIIYGPARFQVQNVAPQSNSSFASKDLPIRVTPGMIAWCAIITLYLLSGDGEFTTNGVGSYSGINYKEHFATYKQMIIAARGSNWHTDLMTAWQKAVFPRGIASAAATQTKAIGGPEGQNSPEDARRLAHGNELVEFLQRLTISAGSAPQEDSLSQANQHSGDAQMQSAPNTTPEAGPNRHNNTHSTRSNNGRNVEGSSGENGDVAGKAGGHGSQTGSDENAAGSNGEGEDGEAGSAEARGAPDQASSEANEEVASQNAAAAPVGDEASSDTQSSVNSGREFVPRPRPAARPSLAETEPDVPPPSPPPHALRRTYSFVGEDALNNSPSSQHEAPEHFQHASAGSQAQAEQATCTQAESSRPANVQVNLPPSNVISTRAPAAETGAGRRARSGKKPVPKSVLADNDALGIDLEIQAPKILRSRASRNAAKGGA